MVDSERTHAIADKSRCVRQHFVALIHLLGTRQGDNPRAILPSAISDALDRFNLWAGNLGALHRPETRLSLDYRLSGAVEIRDEICRQLDEIVEAVEDLRSIVWGQGRNHHTGFDMEIGVELLALEAGVHDDTQTVIEPADEANMILEIISECISSLLRIGVLVKKSTVRDRFERALRSADLIFPDQFDISYIKEKYPKIKADWLLTRLGRANAKRRQVIKYYQDHRSRLGAEETDGDILGPASESFQSEATTFIPHHTLESLQGELERRDADDDAMSLTSATSSSSMDIHLPRLAELSEEGEPFECPICCALQCFKREKSWRIHAFRDLKAYTCTVGDAGCKDELFGDRDSWFKHELKYHRARYNCVLCTHGLSLTLRDFQVHILQTHRSLSNQQRHMLEDASQETAPSFTAQDCPFCDWADVLRSRKDIKGKGVALDQSYAGVLVSSRRFKRHVATHQEQFAVFVLPQANDESDNARESKSTVGPVSDALSRSEDDGEVIASHVQQPKSVTTATSHTKPFPGVAPLEDPIQPEKPTTPPPRPIRSDSAGSSKNTVSYFQSAEANALTS